VRFTLAPVRFTLADARHELNTQDVREPKYAGALAMGIGMDGVRLNVAFVLIERVQDVHALVGTARNEAAEQGDVQVRDVVVGDAAKAAEGMCRSASRFRSYVSHCVPSAETCLPEPHARVSRKR